MGFFSFLFALFGKKRTAAPAVTPVEQPQPQQLPEGRARKSSETTTNLNPVVNNREEIAKVVQVSGGTMQNAAIAEKGHEPTKGQTLPWRKSEAHILLLSRFLAPQEVNNLLENHWEGVLKEHPKTAIDRFFDQGLLVPGSLAAKLSCLFKATEIKDLLRRRGLPVSGPKDQGIARLVAADPEGIKALVDHLAILECSQEARYIVTHYVSAQKAKHQASEKQSFDQLQRRDLRAASLTVARFEAGRVFPRGVGIHWTDYDPTQDIATLKTIFEERPKIVASLAEDRWEPFRVAAGMMLLWGTNRASQWLPAEITTGLKLNSDTVARMILFHANHQIKMGEYRRSGVVKSVKIVGSQRSCPACRKIAGKLYPLDKVPELPYPNCTCELGCRCDAVPVVEE